MADIHPELTAGWTAQAHNRPAVAPPAKAGDEDVWKPTDQGPKGMSTYLEHVPATTVGTTVADGVMRLVAVKLTKGQTATGVKWIHKTGGTTPANAFVGLLNSSGARVAVSANVSTTVDDAGGESTVKSAAFASAYKVPASGVYYVAVLAGTAGGWTLGGATVGQINLNAADGAERSMTLGTGLTAIPATNTLTSGNAVNDLPWLGVY